MAAAPNLEIRSSARGETRSKANVQVDLKTITADIQMRMRRSVDDVLFIGHQLVYVKEEVLNYGEFEAWCSDDLEISRASRNRMMQAYRRFGQMSQLDTFELSSLYLLAAPSTPDSAVEEVLSHKDKRLSIPQVKQIVSCHRAQPPRAPDRVAMAQRQIALMSNEEYAEFLLRLDGQSHDEKPAEARLSAGSSWEILQLAPGASAQEIEARATALTRRYEPKTVSTIRRAIRRAKDELLAQCSV